MAAFISSLRDEEAWRKAGDEAHDQTTRLLVGRVFLFLGWSAGSSRPCASVASSPATSSPR
jgi:hypothetical protein